MGKLLKIVNDTNVWLSALYFSGKPSQIVQLIEKKIITSVISTFILNETREKMVENFNTPISAASGTIAYIASISELVEVGKESFGLRDPADNQILETAVKGKCDFLVTGDKDLLILKKYKNLQIVTPAQFLIKCRN